MMTRGPFRLKTLLNDTGLSSRTSWHNTSIALLDDTGFHRLTTPMEVLTYNGLSLADKARPALLMKTAAKACLNSAMDDIPAREWAEGVAGTRVWERFLYPLVSAKFGQNCDEISAAWLAGRIGCRSSRRWHGERLGYIDQGFFQLSFRLADGWPAGLRVHFRRERSFRGQQRYVPEKRLPGAVAQLEKLIRVPKTAYQNSGRRTWTG